MTKYIYIKSDGRAKVECLAQIRWNDPQQLEAWLLSWGYSCVAAPLLKCSFDLGGEPDVCGWRRVDRRGIKMYFYSRSSLDPGGVYVELPSNRISPLHHAILARVGDGGARNPLSPPISTFPYSRTPTGIAPSLYVSARTLLKHSTSRARTQLDKWFH